MINVKIADETYGVLLPFIQDSNITDIQWDGHNLWIDDLEKGKYISDVKLDTSFINIFTQRLADSINESFNASKPVLEGETENLRIACLHESVTNTGTTITIRKTEAKCRITDESIVETGYCTEDIRDFLKQCIKARCSMIVIGDTGSGKTELVKYLIQSIPDKVNTMTVEDNYELRAKALRPNFNCIEVKTTDKFTNRMAMKASLRHNIKWLILSEARSVEALDLIEAASTGCSIITTIHSWDVRNIPERFENMIGETSSNVTDDVHNFFDIGVLIIKKEVEGGFQRSIGQICIFDKEKGNRIQMLYDRGKLKEVKFPKKIKDKFDLYGVKQPWLLKGGYIGD